MTAETPRMVIVPAEPTDEMWSVLQELQDYEGYSGCGGITADEAAKKLVEASPNAGKIRRADLKRALKAAHAAWMAHYDPVSPPADELERRQEDALAAALGLKIAEEGDSTDA